MSLALFIDPAALANLAAHDPARAARRPQPRRLPARGRRRQPLHLRDLLRARRAAGHASSSSSSRPRSTSTSPACSSTEPERRRVGARCAARLFGDAVLRARSRSTTSATRYRAANDNAHRYAAWLETDVRRAAPDPRDARRAAPVLPPRPRREARSLRVITGTWRSRQSTGQNRRLVRGEPDNDAILVGYRWCAHC